jgi:seryl-tRNA synthetase
MGKRQKIMMVVKKGGELPTLYEGAVPHWELIKKYDLVDFETGVKLTGSGFLCTKERVLSYKEH